MFAVLIPTGHCNPNTLMPSGSRIGIVPEMAKCQHSEKISITLVFESKCKSIKNFKVKLLLFTPPTFPLLYTSKHNRLSF